MSRWLPHSSPSALHAAIRLPAATAATQATTTLRKTGPYGYPAAM
ncbi:hypothetical protein SANTM175S_09535 [Streptomyces antimycoticus]